MENVKIAILDAVTLGKDIDLSSFSALGKIEVYDLTEREEVIPRLAGKDVCIINKVRLDSHILCQLPSLRLICVAATGYDNIDIEYCRTHSIAVCNVAGYSANSVSQLTLAMVLSASVHLPEYRASVANGTYSAGNVQNILFPVYHELAGKTWGIIGYGGIGKRVGDVAKALGCQVIVYKRTPIQEEECVTFKELLERSDIVTVHVPLNEHTRGMIGKEELAMMKEGAFLINVARGAITDEEAVADAVEAGKLGFFGCDVYSTEPMSVEHPFYRIRNRHNVCLTPHMAWGAYESRERCMDEIYKNILSYYDGQMRNRIV